MPGKLPAARPISSDYGPNMIDSKPVKDPERQSGAQSWNDLKADASYAARMSALARFRISNNGTVAALISAVGPESLNPANVVVARTGQGIVTVDWSGTGLAATTILPVARHASQHRLAGVVGNSTTGCTVFTESRTVSSGLIQLDDSDFDLLLF